ncbi:ADP-ribosylation factor-binding protein GGA3 isoform X4 [Phyllopteryx taeniolatus]|uniref:ADP-ribosylation factor-binding protein GGA3 isoform X4 n=1 Tax=Phyllopteryx taeniolatus TaxID=161469 RepID=UPI002AD3BD89|nr:ADP-ribosylation factor-binding protein GGA3 isoform X4 [Phyllopteryx taeniolatus]
MVISRDALIAMAYQEGESLESWLNKATHPANRQEDWEYIIGFCDQVNKELEGPQIAIPLLVHKIHSPQEWEALQALTVLEACMKNCGRRFHNEVGKYRFLNELIKVVSPKYMGDTAPEKVKTKIVEMLYSWTVAFPNEAKINEAYQTLRRQGLVTRDPELPLDRTLIPSPPTRPKHPVFDNEDMGKLLAELLRSKNPEDLQEANRLIKNMVKEDEVRVQKASKRNNTLEEVNINVKLLSEMLSHYDKNASSESDKEIIKELYERCDKLRRAAFKMATEAEDNDASLGDILQASDDLSRVINSYKTIVEGLPINGDSQEARGHARRGLNDDLPALLSDQSKPKPDEASNQWTSLQQAPASSTDLFGSSVCPGSLLAPAEPAAASLRHLQDLAMMGFPDHKSHMTMGSSFGVPAVVPPPAAMPSALSPASLLQGVLPGSPALTQNLTSVPGSPLFRSLSPARPALQGSPARAAQISLSDVHVPMEAIRPSQVLPVTAYDKDGVRVLLNFASDSPPGRPDVLVMVVSMLNTAPLPVHGVVLQAAVPKSMKVKLQPPSGTELAGFSPILPPASITQIMLLANPAKEKVRLRYKLAFTLGDVLCNEVGEVDQFPPPEAWGHL